MINERYFTSALFVVRGAIDLVFTSNYEKATATQPHLMCSGFHKPHHYFHNMPSFAAYIPADRCHTYDVRIMFTRHLTLDCVVPGSTCRKFCLAVGKGAIGPGACPPFVLSLPGNIAVVEALFPSPNPPQPPLPLSPPPNESFLNRLPSMTIAAGLLLLSLFASSIWVFGLPASGKLSYADPSRCTREARTPLPAVMRVICFFHTVV